LELVPICAGYRRSDRTISGYGGGVSFFLESALLRSFLCGERSLSGWSHRQAGFAVFVGSWLSGFFIVLTNAWMQLFRSKVAEDGGGQGY
jgi:hypothetical protein